MTLEEALSGAVPECAGRMVVSLRGDETREDLAKLKGLDAEFLMMDPVPHLSPNDPGAVGYLYCCAAWLCKSHF